MNKIEATEAEIKLHEEWRDKALEKGNTEKANFHQSIINLKEYTLSLYLEIME